MDEITITNTHFTSGDFIVLGILIISALFGLMRGLTREIFSIVGWTAAVLAVIFGFHPLQPITQDFIHNPQLADFITALLLFAGTLIVVSIFTHMLSSLIHKSRTLGATDRSLGFIFGLLRGGLIICLLYLLYSVTVPNLVDQPAWIKNARSQPLIRQGVEWIKSMLAATSHESPVEEEQAAPVTIKNDEKNKKPGYKGAQKVEDWPTPPEP
jgi:membrane protein required for colicin V production